MHPQISADVQMSRFTSVTLNSNNNNYKFSTVDLEASLGRTSVLCGVVHRAHKVNTLCCTVHPKEVEEPRKKKKKSGSEYSGDGEGSSIVRAAVQKRMHHCGRIDAGNRPTHVRWAPRHAHHESRNGTPDSIQFHKTKQKRSRQQKTEFSNTRFRKKLTFFFLLFFLGLVFLL